MPQYRKLHVKILDSFDFNEMPDDFTRLMWMLLPLGVCSQGRGIDHPSWVRSRLFPMRTDVTLEMVSAALDWYAERGMIRRYRVGSRGYFYLTQWEQYQGDTSREAASPYPAPPAEGETRAEVARNSGPGPEESAPPITAEADGAQGLLRGCSGVGQELVASNSGVAREEVGERSRSDTNTTTNADADATTTAKGSAPDGAVVVVEPPDEEEAFELLVKCGITEAEARRLAKCPLEQVRRWIAVGRKIASARPGFNAAGLVVARLRSGEAPPPEAPAANGWRYISGEYAEFIQY